jgi:hypothetical protein
MTDTGWTCKACGYLNLSHHSACNACDGKGRATSPKPDASTPATSKPDASTPATLKPVASTPATLKPVASTPAAPAPNPDVLSEKTAGSEPHPLLLFALAAGVVVCMLSICAPMAYLSIPLMALSYGTPMEMFIIVPIAIMGLGGLGAFVVLAVGARVLDRKRARKPKARASD